MAAAQKFQVSLSGIRYSLIDKERSGHRMATRLVFAIAQNVVTRYPATFAGVVELVDTRDLKSLAPNGACRFESGLRHIIRFSRVE